MTAPRWTTPQLNFDHLLHMTDDRGTFEHALFAQPRPEHGYCTDDMARVLVVTSRQADASPAVRQLTALTLDFLNGAIDSAGRCRNRMNRHGSWEDRPSLDDCWGRALWGLGTLINRDDDGDLRHPALSIFERSCSQRSTAPRTMAFAALGAAELLDSDPRHLGARELLTDAADLLAGLGAGHGSANWIWPEPRLTYANAVLPEAMIAAASALRRPALLARGLTLLGWLLDRETVHGHLSVTPAGGAGPEDRPPGFDQQPIEVAAMADACARAATVDSNGQWSNGVQTAVEWFLGGNDCGVPMWDGVTHGGYDGLEVSGPNLNQGTESTLAFLSTLQHSRSLAHVNQ
jgi:hypothetical protein